VTCMPERGRTQDEIEALAWFNISAMSGSQRSVSRRTSLEQRLGAQMSVVAQQRTKEILKEIAAAKASQAATAPDSSEAGQSASPRSSGSGAIISAQASS